ncbi:hypothetical protein, partial [Okeania sp. SIO2C9]|uniref:hypothetical protein n=1 Tax=Okeania sp. SIO2C9 TaxID=2607791 RepID=UPI0025F1132A
QKGKILKCFRYFAQWKNSRSTFTDVSHLLDVDSKYSWQFSKIIFFHDISLNQLLQQFWI